MTRVVEKKTVQLLRNCINASRLEKKNVLDIHTIIVELSKTTIRYISKQVTKSRSGRGTRKIRITSPAATAPHLNTSSPSVAAAYRA